jgi:hypothetical protein
LNLFVGDLDQPTVSGKMNVWDPFMGTGSTGIVTVRSGGFFYGSEIHEETWKMAAFTLERDNPATPTPLPQMPDLPKAPNDPQVPEVPEDPKVPQLPQ